MSALYTVKYSGQHGAGGAVVYVGKGIIVGVDETNTRYEGNYTENSGRLKGGMTLTSPPGGASLVTGEVIPGGTKLRVTLDWPSDFANGQSQDLRLGGQSVYVMLEKIGDIP